VNQTQAGAVVLAAQQLGAVAAVGSDFFAQQGLVQSSAQAAFLAQQALVQASAHSAFLAQQAF